MLPAPEAAAQCSDPSGRRLLFRYAAREASEFEQRAFERHMLECDLCYEDFLAVWRVGEIVDDWPAEEGTKPEDSSSTEILPDPQPQALSRSFGREILWLALGIGAGLLVSLAL